MALVILTSSAGVTASYDATASGIYFPFVDHPELLDVASVTLPLKVAYALHDAADVTALAACSTSLGSATAASTVATLAAPLAASATVQLTLIDWVGGGVPRIRLPDSYLAVPGTVFPVALPGDLVGYVDVARWVLPQLFGLQGAAGGLLGVAGDPSAFVPGFVLPFWEHVPATQPLTMVYADGKIATVGAATQTANAPSSAAVLAKGFCVKMYFVAPPRVGGGLRLSQNPRTVFADELEGDLVIATSTSNQRVLIGGGSNENSTLSVSSNSVYCTGTLYTPNYVQSSGIHLGIYHSPDGFLPADLTDMTTTSLAEALRITSNQAFGGPGATAVAAASNLTVHGTLSATSNFGVTGAASVGTDLRVGSNLTVGSNLAVAGSATVGSNLTVVGTVTAGQVVGLTSQAFAADTAAAAVAATTAFAFSNGTADFAASNNRFVALGEGVYAVGFSSLDTDTAAGDESVEWTLQLTKKGAQVRTYPFTGTGVVPVYLRAGESVGALMGPVDRTVLQSSTFLLQKLTATVAPVAALPGSVFTLRASDLTASPATAWGPFGVSTAPGRPFGAPAWSASGGGLQGTLPYVQFSKVAGAVTALFATAPMTLSAGTHGGLTYVTYVAYAAGSTAFSFSLSDDVGGGDNFFAMMTNGSWVNAYGYPGAGGTQHFVNTGDGTGPFDTWTAYVTRITTSGGSSTGEFFRFSGAAAVTAVADAAVHVTETLAAPWGDQTYALAEMNDDTEFTGGNFKLNYASLWDRPLSDADIVRVVNAIKV